MPAGPRKMCTNTFIYQIWRRQIHILNKVGNGEKVRSGSLQMLTLVTQESVMGAEGKNTELLGDKEWRNWKGSIFTRGARQNTQSWRSASIKMKKHCRVSGFRGEYNMKMDKEWFFPGLSGNSCHFRTHKYNSAWVFFVSSTWKFSLLKTEIILSEVSRCEVWSNVFYHFSKSNGFLVLKSAFGV